MHQRYVAGNLQGSGDMPAGAIQHHHRMHITWQFTGKLPEERVHHFRVHMRADQPAGVAGLGTDGAEDIQIIVLRLMDRTRP